MRMGYGRPVMTCQTSRPTPAACTRTSTSSSAISGMSMSLGSRTSAEPYSSWTIAFMVSLLHCLRPPHHSLRSEATHSLARLLRPFVVTLDVYTFDRKPEEKRKFPNERTYPSNQAKCLCVLGVKNVSIGIYQIAQGRKNHHDAQNPGKVARLVNQIAEHSQMKAEKQLPNKNPISVYIEKYQRESLRLSWFEYRQVTSTAQKQQGSKIRKQIDPHNDGHRQPGKRRNQRERSAYRSE